MNIELKGSLGTTTFSASVIRKSEGWSVQVDFVPVLPESETWIDLWVPFSNVGPDDVNSIVSRVFKEISRELGST